MKTLFIPAKSRVRVDEYEIRAISRELPKNIAIVYSVQYENQAKRIRKILSENHAISQFRQILGCSKLNLSKSAEAILLIGEGKFHTLSLANSSKLPIYIYNTKFEKLPSEELNKFQKRKKSSYVNFLNSRKAGILVSVKQGQQNLKKALELKPRLKNKNAYLFIADSINTPEFENFSEIQSWINTACPRLDMASNKIINMNELNLGN